MHTDHIFIQGGGHHVCQDYATSGQFYDALGGEVAYAIVSDGCSTAPDTDIGARLMTLTALKVIKAVFAAPRNFVTDPNFVQTVIATEINNEVLIHAHVLGLRKETLLATLLIAVYHKQLYQGVIFQFGDGASLVKYKDGHFAGRSHEFKSGAPNYLIYKFDEDMRNAYARQFGDYALVTEFWTHDRPSTVSSHPYDMQINHQIVNKGQVDSIILFSDGIRSFTGDVPPNEVNVIHEFTNFKQTTGSFIQRRVKNALIQYKKANHGHFDDIGVAGIFVGDLSGGDIDSHSTPAW